jgi:peptidyl-prolyl cis-trans isomerase B (cyclophilin B)
VASSIKRERQLARERYERQQAKRTAARARRRRWQQVTAAVVAVLLVIGGVAALTVLLGNDDDGTTAAADPTTSPSESVSESPSESASPSPSASAGGCAYTRTAEEAAKDVGIPTYEPATAKRPFTATLKTNRGDIVVDMAAADAPCTTNSFRHLASESYYDSTSCHRLTTQNLFVLQCGDPTATGGGGPGYQFGVENGPADGMYPAGTVAMARTSDPNTNGSQFFIVYRDTQLPTEGGGYTIFGRVTEGLDVVEQAAEAGVEGGGGDGKPAQPVVIESVEIGSA